MSDRPREDQPDVVLIGPVSPIPIIEHDDPRFIEEERSWSAARRRAQAMHSPDELLAGLVDADWRVRHEVVDRLVARAASDPRTVPALLDAVTTDPAWEVRDAVAMRLNAFDAGQVQPALEHAVEDSSPDVRWSARYSLFQLGLGPHPGDMAG